jgi:hypothetical protein
MTRRAPKLAPAHLVEAPPASTPSPTAPAVATLASRNFAAATEVIRTPCGRVIERTAVVVKLTVRRNAFKGEPDQVLESIADDNTYRLWEPVVDGASYSATKTTAGHLWGQAQTRRPREKLEVREAIEWEMQQEKRAIDVIRANCIELAGKVSDAVFETCGIIRLLGNPRIHAERAAAARKARPC